MSGPLSDEDIEGLRGEDWEYQMNGLHVENLLATIDALQARLAAAEAERDKLRDDCDELRHQTETQTEMTRRTLLYGDTMKGERNAAQARLAAAEAVVEAARELAEIEKRAHGAETRMSGPALAWTRHWNTAAHKVCDALAALDALTP